MEFLYLTPAQLVTNLPRLLRFIRTYGEGRITHRALRWLRSFTGEEDEEPGTLFLVAKENQRIAGFFSARDYGRKESFIVIHPRYRNQGLGRGMVQESLTRMDKFYGRIALDNLPSLKMALALGMVGFHLTKGPTGKPTLWVGIGNWRKEDVE